MEKLTPGRELDALIAEKVMGLPLMKSAFHDDLWFADSAPVPRYSTDIAAAWQVVEKLVSMGYIAQVVERGPADCWASFRQGDTIFAETAPHAICLAALKAVGNE